MKYLICGVTAITQDAQLGILKDTDILVSDGKIAAIGKGLSAEGAERIEGKDMLCLPGFVDAHRHVFEALIRQTGVDWNHAQYFEGVKKTMGTRFTPEMTYISSYTGALECLNAGITTVYDWFHNNNSPAHADAELLGLQKAGVRAVFGCSDGAAGEIPVSTLPMDYADMRRLAKQYFQSKDQLLTLSLASRGPQFTVMERVREEIQLAKELDVFVSMHVGDGAWGKSYPVKRLYEQGVLDDTMLFVHCNTLHEEELDILGTLGAGYVFCPEVELNMGHGFPVARALMQRGLAPALGIDVVTSIPGDMFGAMRAALVGIRSKVNAQALIDGVEVDPLPVLATDVLHFATMNGARACRLAEKIGSITVGKQADLILIDTDAFNLLPYNNPVSAVVEGAHVGNVDTVMVNGRLVKQHGKMLCCEMSAVRKEVNAARDKLFAEAGVPTDGSWVPQTLYENISVEKEHKN